MRAQEGKLDMSKKWELVDVEYSEDDYEACENCGNIIRNIAIVKSDEDQKRIGLDCMEVIVSMLPSLIQQTKNDMRRLVKFVKFLKMECKTVIIGEHTKWFFKEDIEKWNPNFIYRISHESKYNKYVDLEKCKIIKE